MRKPQLVLLSLFCWLLTACDLPAQSPPPVEEASVAADGWSSSSPRDEIRPVFQIFPRTGPDGQHVLAIQADEREGLAGTWSKTFPIIGGRSYRFFSLRRTTGILASRRTAVVRLLWQDARGKKVNRDQRSFPTYRPGDFPAAEPEYLPDGNHRTDGWTEVTSLYTAPRSAAQVLIELHYRWEPKGRAEWTIPTIEESEAPVPRVVRLATVHYCPSKGRTPAEKCEQFADLIAKAAAKKADLVVLPETLTYFGSGSSFADVAEPIPGPSTDYFGMLARQHNLYVVAGLVERDAHLIFNVAVLIGPDGQLAGKYRKVTLPRGEIEAGLTPGTDYPVFNTRFGRVGMMICYDGFFPEVARELSNNGAEIIAWPVWGCNPLLARARACENHVWLISSTYTDVSSDWMISAVFDRAGSVAAQAVEFGTIAIHEADLSQPLYWQSLGDFRAQINPHRPLDAEQRSAWKARAAEAGSQ